MSQSDSSKFRIYGIYVGLLIFAVAVAVRMFTIQLVEADEWLARAEKVTTSYRDVQPDRGHIYSDDGRLLATSVPEYEIRFDTRADGIKQKVWDKGIDSLSWQLSTLFGDRTPREYKRDLQNARGDKARYFLIQRKVQHDKVKALREFPIWREGRYRGGLIVEKSTVRVRPFGRMASRTVGYLLKNGQAVGLEAGYDEYLKGTTGQRLERRLAGGVWMPLDDSMGIRPESGSDVYSTIDVNLQDVADAALENTLTKHNAQYGTVVVMEVSTGKVKAISNLTREEDGSYIEAYNWAVGAATEPGSTFKLPAIMVAMEKGGLKLTDMVDTENGTSRFYDRTMRDSHEGGYGKISMQRAFELSSNVGMSKRITKAFKSDPSAFVNGLRDLGLSDPLGVSIPGEGTPVLWGPGDQNWSGVSLPWLSIGYGVQVTPLQTLAFYNGVANNGKLMRPLFVDRLVQGGEVTEQFEPVVLKDNMCSKETLRQVRELLEAVVDSGTATNLRTAHFKIAGKTGTAQIAANNRYRSEGEVSYQASFVGYFPASAPKYSCIVVVSAPSKKRGYYGNVVAGPVFKEIADKIYANRIELQNEIELAEIEGPTSPISMSGSRADLLAAFEGLGLSTSEVGETQWVTTRAGEDAVALLERDLPSELTNKVPNVIGMGLRDALYILENRGLHVEITGYGMVKTQSMSAGDLFVNGSTIQLVLGL